MFSPFASCQAYWIPTETALAGTLVRLIPLTENHFEPLTELGRDERIWASFPVSRADVSRHLRHLAETFSEMQRGLAHAFAIETAEGLAGLTRLFHLNPSSRQCEIGSWLAPAFWGRGVNVEAKFLLLQFCFEAMDMVRVQFRTDANNRRSRLALEKMGAQLEGIFRNERIREDGSTRDAAFYSIIDREWAAVRERLLEKMARQKSADVPGASLQSDIAPAEQTAVGETALPIVLPG